MPELFTILAARYYQPNLSIWLSVDPMAAKYPSLSPYTYCANNPVVLKDPNGDTLRFALSCSKEFKNKFAQTIQFMNSKKTSGIIARIHRNKETVYIAEYSGKTHYSHGKRTIYWNSELGAETDNGTLVSPATILNHEADHAIQCIENPEQVIKDKNTKDDHYHNAEEKRVITGSEQRTALKHGEIKEGQVTRTNHNVKKWYPTISPTSTQKKPENETDL